MDDWFVGMVHGLSLGDIINTDWSWALGTNYPGLCDMREAFSAAFIRLAIYSKVNCRNVVEVLGRYGSREASRIQLLLAQRFPCEKNQHSCQRVSPPPPRL